MPFRFPSDSEWLEADGLGGFATGSADGIRRRRYHGILNAARQPPVDRVCLVNGFEATVTTLAGAFSLSSHLYDPDLVHPDGVTRIVSFEPDPWPTWTFRLDDGTEIIHELFVPRGVAMAVLVWRLARRVAGAKLEVRPLLSGRGIHSLHRENGNFRFAPENLTDKVIRFRPYDSIPAVVSIASGRFSFDPRWYRNFAYEEERRRGFDFLEDLASPGRYEFDIEAAGAVWIVAAGDSAPRLAGQDPLAYAEAESSRERARRGRFPSRLERSAEAYLVRRGNGETIIAGYPWFADWGRDSFISLRGLCLATGRLEEAQEILLEWSGTVSEGMIPNRFVESGAAAEFNSVDASLWFVVVAGEFLAEAGRRGFVVTQADRRLLEAAVIEIIRFHCAGTRYGIRMDEDGLLAAGVPGLPLTWMDARSGQRSLTPRIGKPVEIQALWVNALAVAEEISPEWGPIRRAAESSFGARFWNIEEGCLHDVIDAGGVAGAVDSSMRPNQIFAVGGLPIALIGAERAQSIVDQVGARLWTPMGLRSLAVSERGYEGRYEGGAVERDEAYHQGTVWPWLIGAFVEAWVRVHGGGTEAKSEARQRFLVPLLRNLDEAGLGHFSEIADGDSPHAPRGAPFQAWSLAEVLRLEKIVLAERSDA